jgi:hypothetical protein
MLNHLMLASLKDETQREWKLITAPHADTPTTAELITFLESRCRALELLQTIPSSRAATASPRSSQSTGSMASKHSYPNVATQVQCPLCNESHRLFKCDKFLKLQPEQRHTQAKQLKLCFNCLHLPRITHVQNKCADTHKKHHTLLHMDRTNQRMTKGLAQTLTNLQMQRAQLQRLTLTIHSKANRTIAFCLQQLFWKLGTSLVNIFHAEHC